MDIRKGGEKMAKSKVLLSLDEDIAQKLKDYAREQHMTMSAAVTAWVLRLKVSDPQVRGQMSLETPKKPAKTAAKKARGTKS